MTDGQSPWQMLMRSQKQDLERLQQVDAALNEHQDNLDADIDNILKKQAPFPFYLRPAEVRESNDILSGNPSANGRKSLAVVEQVDDDEQEEGSVTARSKLDISSPRSKQELGSPRKDLPKGSEASMRYQNAKLKTLTKQVEDGLEIRKQLNDQINDLQKQLKIEREENKNIKKRIQTLEIESKKTNRRGSSAVETTDQVESLNQEIAGLKKDLQTAERLAKQSESNTSAKDVQLKRALDSVTRLKAQVTELQAGSGKGGDSTGRVTELEQQVSVMEKQRNELLAAFRKQMKLIDVLKRQKAHLEAARLLAFTEEEFMKMLDWAV